MLDSFDYDLSQVCPHQYKSLEAQSPSHPIFDDFKQQNSIKEACKTIEFLKGDITGHRLAREYTIGPRIDKGSFGAIHSCTANGSG